MSQAEYLEYLKGIASQIDDSGIAQEYRPAALQLMAKPWYYAQQEGISQKKEAPMVSITEIAKTYGLTIKGDELLFPKGGIGNKDDYLTVLALVKKHGYMYGGKGSYKFVKVS